jgi:glutamine amidotransferase
VLFVHNGFVADWPHLRRELTMAVDPELYPYIEGSTDSEVMFYLALSFGLDYDPLGALARMPGSSRPPGTGTAPSTRCR